MSYDLIETARHRFLVQRMGSTTELVVFVRRWHGKVLCAVYTTEPRLRRLVLPDLQATTLRTGQAEIGQLLRAFGFVPAAGTPGKWRTGRYPGTREDRMRVFHSTRRMRGDIDAEFRQYFPELTAR